MGQSTRMVTTGRLRFPLKRRLNSQWPSASRLAISRLRPSDRLHDEDGTLKWVVKACPTQSDDAPDEQVE